MKKDEVKDLVKELLMKMLGDNYEMVIERSRAANEKGERYEFFREFTWTTEEQDEFSKWAVERIRKELKMNKKRAEKEVSFFLMMYGLQTK